MTPLALVLVAVLAATATLATAASGENEAVWQRDTASGNPRTAPATRGTWWSEAAESTRRSITAEDEDPVSVFMYEEAVNLERVVATLRARLDQVYQRVQPLVIGATANSSESLRSSTARLTLPWSAILRDIGRVGVILEELGDTMRPYIARQEERIIKQSLGHLPQPFRFDGVLPVPAPLYTVTPLSYDQRAYFSPGQRLLSAFQAFQAFPVPRTPTPNPPPVPRFVPLVPLSGQPFVQSVAPLGQPFAIVRPF